MSSLSSFIISFTTYYNNGVTTTVSTYPTAPDMSSSDISANISNLINTLETQGITLKNNSSVKRSTNSISTELQSGNYSSDIETMAAELPNSTSSASQLIDLLKQLKEKIDSSTSTETSVEDDTEDTKNASISSVQTNSQKFTSSVPITSPTSKDEELSSLTSSVDTTNKSLNKLLNTLKSSVSSMNTSLQNSTKNSSSRSASSTLSSILGSSTTTTSSTVSRRNDNFFNNLVNNLLFQPTTQTRNRNRRNKNLPPTKPSTNNTSGLLSQISKLSTDLNTIPNASVNTSTTTTTTNTSDFYSISTQVKDNSLSVMYSYFQANSNTSSHNITFYLSQKSLMWLSMNAYEAAKNLSVSEKSNLCMKSGLNGSDTSDNALWAAYLICILSFLSRCVSSQLYSEDPIAPSSISGLSSYNYMLGRQYLESVGNFGLNLQQYGKDSDESSFIELAVPGKWSDLMYSKSVSVTKPGTAHYESNSILSILNNL